ncbi:thioredoxin domain-containing protein 9-like [Paramacrobiotus metropolitanus]|uniref:thioredoxin domain-containing protein 9-like n=1 Tax=Paramacrobiotus metropolitanus TaxID=2943436 RepID=UPI002445C631|nr:thioredoxin domain-containing protein 9-like [Paramacrobiotus metropolitanus]
MEKILEQQLLQAGKIVEAQLDSEIKRLDELASNEDDLEALRERRLQAMKNEALKKQEWRSNGHGVFSELGDEKDFFQACKKSKNLVCHFYRPTTQRCQIVDQHLELLARDHLETRFVKINVERCHFLAERLRIVVIPTIALVLDDKVVDYIVGFDDVGGRDDFATAQLEWRLAHGKVINFSGDLSIPPTKTKAPASASTLGRTQNLRSKANDSADSDSD